MPTLGSVVYTFDFTAGRPWQTPTIYGWAVPGYPDASDLTITEGQFVRVLAGAGPAGQNVLAHDPTQVWDGFNGPTLIAHPFITGLTTVMGNPTQQWFGWDATKNRFAATIRFDTADIGRLVAAGARGSDGTSVPIMEIPHSYGHVQININYGAAFGRGISGADFIAQWSLIWTDNTGGHSNISSNLTIDADTWYDLIVDWKCGTRTGPTSLNDGCIRVSLTPTAGGSTLQLFSVNHSSLHVNSQLVIDPSQDAGGSPVVTPDYNYADLINLGPTFPCQYCDVYVQQITVMDCSTAARNLLTGQDHSVQGNDNVIAGRQGTISTADMVALFSLDDSPHTVSTSKTFEVHADFINLNGTTSIGGGTAVTDINAALDGLGT